MDAVTCIHPTCNEQLRRGCVCCWQHWRALPQEFKDRYPEARRQGDRAVRELNEDVTQHFGDNMIGDNDIVACNREDCEAKIVWLDGQSGRVPVAAEDVNADDTCFMPKRHERHSPLCPVRENG